jgi:hypothetical protein
MGQVLKQSLLPWCFVESWNLVEGDIDWLWQWGEKYNCTQVKQKSNTPSITPFLKAL